MNKYVYAATMIGLFSVTTNGYTVDVTTNQSQEAANIINITANRTALLDLDTPVSTSVLPKRICKIAALRLPLMRSPMYQV